MNNSLRFSLFAAGVALLTTGCESTVNINEQIAPTPAVNTPTPTAWLTGKLQVTPSTWNYGPVGVGCRGEQVFALRNVGQTPVRVYGISTEVEPEVFLVDDLSGTLNYLDTWEFPALFVPNGFKQGSYGEIWIQSDDTHGDLLRVELTGEVSPGAERLDQLKQIAATPSDFLWVMDASGSMDSDLNRVLASFNSFIEGLYNEGVNYHMGFVTMDIPNDMGRLIGTYGTEGLPYVTRDMGDTAIQDLKFNMSVEAVDNQDDTEAGLQAISMALSEDYLSTWHEGFIREDAQLVIVVITDDSDHSNARVPIYRDELLALKGSTDLVAFHGIMAIDSSELESSGGCADGLGDEYGEMVYAFGGVIESVCSSNYNNIMATLGSYDKAETTDTFQLSGPPLLEAGIIVSVGDPDGGNMVEAIEDVAWVYSSVDNAIVFQTDYIPRAGAAINIKYTDAGACEP